MYSGPLTILDCDYAKGPECSCPAELEDAKDVFDYVRGRLELYDPARITLSGFSAGGTVALGLSVMLGEEARKQSLLANPSNQSDTGSRPRHPVKAVMAFYALATWLGERDEPPPIPKGSKTAGVILPAWLEDIMFVGHFFSPLPLYQQRKISPEAEQRRVEELMNRPSISPSLADERDFPSHVVLYTAEHDSFAKKMESLRTKLKEDETINVFGRMVHRVGHGWDLLVQRDQAGYEEWNEACNVCAGIIFRK
ncbi:hypothetical protein FRC16_000361 [Serendipita sp. 398]|nr:hypothetical protein FRC16_000361 [Serendipita sp. 398]